MHIRRLIDGGGSPRFGIFEKVDDVNFRHYLPFSKMDRPQGRISKHFNCKQFHYIGIPGHDLTFGLAIADLRWAATVFVYLHQRGAPFRQWRFTQPLACNTIIPSTPNQGLTFTKGRLHRIEIHSQPGLRKIHLELHKTLRADFQLASQEVFKPMCICTRTGYNGWTYTQKAAGLSVSGHLNLEGQEISLDSHLACYDWTCGYMRRHTFWNWASISGRMEGNKPFGLNLAAGTNETGFTENGFWYDNQFTKVDSVHFEFKRSNPFIPWQMTSSDQKVDLRFQPLGEYRDRKNFWFVAGNFRQMFGLFSGRVRTSTGELSLQDMPGFTEDHYSKW